MNNKNKKSRNKHVSSEGPASFRRMMKVRVRLTADLPKSACTKTVSQLSDPVKQDWVPIASIAQDIKDMILQGGNRFSKNGTTVQ